MTTTKLNRRTWNTYATRGYTHDVANDQASSGGVHLYQVRKAASGWQTRICQSNGRHQSYGPVISISDAEGESHFATAQQEA